MKAMIFAAGLGTRLLPLTENRPKALVELNGIPLLEIAVKNLIKFGCKSIIINIHHHSDMIREFLTKKNNFGIEIQISDESDMLLDTGGGIKKASWFFKDNRSFMVHNVDIISGIDLRRLYNFHINSDSIATLAVSERTSSRYFLFDETKTLCGWKNIKTGEIKIPRKPSGEIKELAFSGIHAADPKIFRYFPPDDKFSIVDFFLKVAVKERITYFEHPNSAWFDVGDADKLHSAESFLTNEKL